MKQWGSICSFCVAIDCNNCNRPKGSDPTKFQVKDHIYEKPPDDVRSTDNYYNREKEQHGELRQALKQPIVH